MTPPATVLDAPRPSPRPSAAVEERRKPSEPWTSGDVTRVAGLSAAGFLAVGVSWFGASGTLTLSHQLLWMVLGIAGAAIAALVQGMFVLTAFRSIKDRRFAIMTDLDALVAPYESGDVRPEATTDPTVRVAAATMVHFHRPTCPLVSGKDATLVGSAEEHAASGRTACGVCAA
jgi:hypothetical protein